eukprot:CAMPEP_0201926904 /NCGR_PEP_ID=MMETSP0903-20130614/17258_1 /ASSEMBLY_ACC=CAM_ASM_000552 /TAXON_ID=420261 /ORGANISM="Thalassiosira antarctica, Strain CCMP982" /LENGTH=157 /DNA_ID=CAMNT_0048464923 /DNA_START=202 /DNA_END=671 /DNA_ORIENTATION=+
MPHAVMNYVPQESFRKKEMSIKAIPKEMQRMYWCQSRSAACLICLTEGPDESGQPLRRDCSCRGESSGFIHLSCLVKYAEQKAEQWDGRDLSEFREPWKVCPNCCQNYQNELAVDLAAKFVTFVEGKYPGDQLKHLVALYLKLYALQGMGLKLKIKG